MDKTVEISQGYESRVRGWERRAEAPLVVVAMAFLAAYAGPILDPNLPPWLDRMCQLVQAAAWFVFAVEYAVRLKLSSDRRRFVRHHLLDLVILTLPMLRPLRALRLLLLLRIFNTSAVSSLRGRVLTYVIAGVLMISFVAALAVLDAERGEPEANIATFGDAVWWAATTVTTVGYGDHFPVTAEGRFVAIGLMLAGIALLGTITASLASWFSERVRAEQAATDALSDQVRALMAEVQALTRRPEHSTLSESRLPEPE